MGGRTVVEPEPAEVAAGARSRAVRLLARLRPEEAVGLGFLALLSVLSLVHSHTPVLRKTAVHRMALAAVLVAVVLALLRRRLSPALAAIRDFLPFVLCVLVYENLHDLVPLVNPGLADPALAAADRALLGVDASVWAERFVTAAGTRVMEAAYSSYYLLPPLLAGWLYLAGERRRFRNVMLGVVFGLYVGYLGYVLVPTVGPRYFLADRFSGSLTGEVFQRSVIAPLMAAHAGTLPRDCFPSLHAATSITVLGFALRYRPRLGWVLAPVVLGLLAATIYLRYHYVVDLIAGTALAGTMLWAAPRIDRAWAALTGRARP